MEADAIKNALPRGIKPNINQQAPLPDTIFGDAERRQLTVLFCDLVGSTQLADRLDPEDMRSILAAYRTVSSEIIAKYGGTVLQYLGDGIVVLFGYPVAHENSTPSAIHAGIEILEAFAGNSDKLAGFDAELNVRIGINTGRVVVGADGAGESGEKLSVIGDVPNLAARLQGLAQEGEIVVSRSTYRLIKNNFAFRELGPQSLKGFAKPVHCYAVVGNNLDNISNENAEFRNNTPLIGREAELKLIEQHWQSARSGDGQVLMLSGEAGVGKSRILQSFNSKLAHENVELIRFFGSSFHMHSTLRPIISEMQNRLELNDEISNDEKFAKLNAILPIKLRHHLTVFCYLFNISTPEANELLELSPEELKQNTFSAILEFYENILAEKPILMEFDDVHWCDPTTLEIINLFINRLNNKHWFLLLSFRPDYSPPFRNLTYITSLSLNRFSKADTRKLVTSIALGKMLPESLTKQIVDRADGIPLYAEEITRMVLESGWVTEEQERYVMNGSFAGLTIPDSLQDSLMARLDRFPSAKEIAQIAATIGRRFSASLLSMVSGHRTSQLSAVLEQLLNAELIYEDGIEPNIVYEFKHALVQDAAYQSLLKTARLECHLRIARALEDNFPEICESEPETLGFHYGSGGMPEKAFQYHETAGLRALASSASLEAINHLENALANLAKMPKGKERDNKEFTLLVKLAVPQATALGYSHESVNRSYERALELAEDQSDKSEIFPVTYGLLRYHLLGARYAEAYQYGASLVEMATKAKDKVMTSASHRSIGATHFYRGNPEQALKELTGSINTGMNQKQRAEALNYDVVDIVVASLSYSAWAEWQLGRADAAIELSEKAMKAARKINHPFSIAFAICFASWTQAFCGNLEKAKSLAEEGYALSTKYSFQFWIGWTEVIAAWSKAHLIGKYPEGVNEIAKGIVNWKETRSRLGLSYFLCLQADLSFQNENYEQALLFLDEADAFVEETDEGFWLPELTRMRGEILFSQNQANHKESLALLEKALQQATEIGAVALALRALTSLVKLELSINGTTDRADELKELAEKIAKGGETDDQENVRQVLSETRSGEEKVAS